MRSGIVQDQGVTRQKWKFQQKISQWCARPHATGSEHHKKSGSRVLVTGIHKGGHQSLMGVVVFSKGPGMGSKCSRY